MAVLVRAGLKQGRWMGEKREQCPNAVTSLIVKSVRELSGMGEDQVEEKKGSS